MYSTMLDLLGKLGLRAMVGVGRVMRLGALGSYIMIDLPDPTERL